MRNSSETKVTQSDKNHLPIKSLNNPKQKEILAHRATKVRDKSHPLILAHRETKVTQSDKNHLPIKSLRLALNTRHTQSHGTEINLTKMPSSDKHHLPIKSLNNPKQKELLAHRATKVTHSVYDFGIQSDKNHLPIKSLKNPKQKQI